ncbi:hypothetical protein BO86DRAFT_136029 [Aspergillus japonicus CBS 114.51]|uniref:Secreted protein n=1 Tax=Aspergillus japonicus CBS 114.51 TaxID=1448312 RepID=A0A8T8WW23_ASPJA|nr:hypothetical protein BO86DRAFT_136029 [Aspergillus japonicus CBS 114.51]RAH80035.1 hypothetical protein BO86DRAFT_136029 [Aspergillus japonicus CBS 114.51]
MRGGNAPLHRQLMTLLLILPAGPPRASPTHLSSPPAFLRLCHSFSLIYSSNSRSLIAFLTNFVFLSPPASCSAYSFLLTTSSSRIHLLPVGRIHSPIALLVPPRSSPLSKPNPPLHSPPHSGNRSDVQGLF